MVAVTSCFIFERQTERRACSRAWAKTGKRIAARIAMIAITTSNSMSVKPRRAGIGTLPERRSFVARSQRAEIAKEKDIETVRVPRGPCPAAKANFPVPIRLFALSRFRDERKPLTREKADRAAPPNRMRV